MSREAMIVAELLKLANLLNVNLDDKILKICRDVLFEERDRLRTNSSAVV